MRLSSGGTVFEEIIQRATEAWPCERPGEVVVESAAPVAVKALGLKWSWREALACYEMVGGENLK